MPQIRFRPELGPGYRSGTHDAPSDPLFLWGGEYPLSISHPDDAVLGRRLAPTPDTLVTRWGLSHSPIFKGRWKALYKPQYTVQHHLQQQQQQLRRVSRRILISNNTSTVICLCYSVITIFTQRGLQRRSIQQSYLYETLRCRSTEQIYQWCIQYEANRAIILHPLRSRFSEVFS